MLILIGNILIHNHEQSRAPPQLRNRDDENETNYK